MLLWRASFLLHFATRLYVYAYWRCVCVCSKCHGVTDLWDACGGVTQLIPYPISEPC